MRRRAACAAVVVACVMAVGAPDARAQGWSVDLSAGRTVYDPLAANVGANNLTGVLRYDVASETWVYGAAAAPLDEQAPFWGGVGAAGRLAPAGAASRRFALGVDLQAHAFSFRDAVVEQTGSGGTLEAMPFASVAGGDMRLELRGGWRGHSLAYSGATQNRGVVEAGARVSHDAAIRLQVDARWVRASEGTFPFAGGSVTYTGSPVGVWAHAGRWFSDTLDDVVWGAGVAVALGTRASVWTAVRQEASDPLYWNAPRRTWSAGITRRLGSPRQIVPAPRAQDGGVLVRVPVSHAPSGQVSIAGSFNDWQPVPMQREGGDWMIRLPLRPGVYQYAFRSAGGEWFVPAGVAGRRDDGMGGHVAVLVVL